MTRPAGFQGAWDRFWFSGGSPRNLAAARIVIALHALWVLLSRDLAGMSDLPAVFWSGVRLSARWRYLLFPGHGTVELVFQWAAAIGLVLVALGLWPRAAALASALLLYHLAPLETIIWTPSPYERGFEVAILALVTLAAAPCGDALSIRPSRRPAGDPGDYRWPLMLIQLFVAQIYFFSFYSKLFRVGWDWISADNIRAWMLVFDQQDQIAVVRGLGVWIADRPAAALLAAVGAMAMDLGFGAGLFWRRAWMVTVPAAFVFHAGIYAVMGIAFLNAPQILVFVNWEWLARRRAAGAVSRRAAPADVPSPRDRPAATPGTAPPL